MTDTKSPLVVVGVDGSPASAKALSYAIEEARLRHGDLHVIYAYPVIERPMTGSTGKDYYEQVEADAKESLEAMMKAAPSTDGVTVQWLGEPGNAAEVLIEASRDATILVIGSRGMGGFTGLLLGSVSTKCVHHSLCPVLVVREDH